MKFKKLLVALLAVVMAVGVAMAFAACGEEKEDPNKKPEGGTNTKSYQLSGEFRDDLSILGGGYDFLLNLNVEGDAVLARYNPFSYDASDAATNPNYTAEYMKGTWKAVQKDGVDCLQIKLAIHKQDGTTESESTLYAYDVAGVYSVEVEFPLVPGMSFTRKVTLTGGENKTYADANAFIQAKKMTFTAPESVTTFESKTQGGEVNATLYVQNGGKVIAYMGTSKISEGTYTKSATEMTVTLDGTPIEVTIEGNKGSFTYTYSAGGMYDVELNFVCDDLTKVPNTDSTTPEPTTQKYTSTTTVNLSMGGYSVPCNLVIELTDETNCKYYATGYSYTFGNFECTYTRTGNVITLTIKEEPAEDTTWDVLKETLTWELDDATNTMKVPAPKYTSTATVQITKPAPMDAHLVIELTDDTNCKFYVQEIAAWGLGSFECTYTREGNVITLTIKEEPTGENGIAIWDVLKETLVWELDVTNNTMTAVTE